MEIAKSTEGQFDSGLDTCEDCDISCSICYGASSSECNSCNDGFYIEGTTCSPCHPSCSTCDGPYNDDCTSCSSPNPKLNNNGNCEDCPIGKYDNGLDSCSNCNIACSSCFGGSSNQCNSCNNGFYLTRNSCNACDSNCLTCSRSETICTSCDAGKILTETDECVEEEKIILRPLSSTTWSIQQQGCIIWTDSVLSYGTTGSIFLEYGPSFSLSKLIASDIDLSILQYQWKIVNVYPGTGRIRFAMRSGRDLYSPEFEIYPPSRRYDDSC